MRRFRAIIAGIWRAVVRHWPVAGAFVALAGAAFVFFWLPALVVSSRHGLTPNQRLQRESDVRTAGLQLLAGVLGVVAVATGYRSYRTAHEGHVTDRYTRAVEQLGHAELDVRIGGIYALERLMRDSPDDQPTVVEVLSAFVRHRGRIAHARPEAEHPDASYTCPLDVQAAVTVVARRDTNRPDAAPDLSGAQLQRAQLPSAAKLAGANLREANLSGAELWDADLRKANLIKANLSTARLSGATLEEADMAFAVALGIQAAGVRGRGLIAYKADLRSAILINASLEEADFTQADLSDTRMQKSRLAGAHFREAKLDGTNFKDADLRSALTDRADWSAARTAGAHLPPRGLGRQEPAARAE